jgi:hypothetical protein
MPRHPRVHAPGLLYHVMARGNDGRKVFLNDSDYGAFLDGLAVARKRYPFYLRRSQPPPVCRTIANQAPHSALNRRFTIPIAASALLLRGLVQHVPSARLRTGLSPVVTSAIYPRLDYFQALGDKTLYVRHTTNTPIECECGPSYYQPAP